MSVWINADDFISSLRKKQWAHELVNGQVVAVPRARPKKPGRGVRWVDVPFLCYSYLQDHPVGRFLEVPPFFMLSEMLPTLRRPDLAFVCSHRLAEHDFAQPLVRTVPDLVVEFIFDAPQWQYKHDRIRDFLQAGSALAWVIDVTTEWVAVYKGNQRPELYRANDKLPGGSVLPHLHLSVYELFE